MRTVNWLGIVLAAALCWPSPARGQLELIVVERPFHAHRLAGIVTATSGAALPGVLVQVCDRAFKRPEEVSSDCAREPRHVLASATTDQNGRFAFKSLKLRCTRGLRLSMNGLDPMEIRVQWRLFAPREVRIEMRVAN